MNFLKKYFIALGIIFGIIFLLALIISILNYFSLIQNNIFKWLKLFIPIISSFIGGFYIGKFAKEKGYLEGIKLGLLFIILMFIVTLLDGNNIKWILIIYYLILLLTSMLGSMIGINRKKDNT